MMSMPCRVGGSMYFAACTLVIDPWLIGERKRAWLAHTKVSRRVTSQMNRAVADRSG